jgi:hypothetical protein
MRFFAEAACYPTALPPSQGMRWDAVDDASANATAVDGQRARGRAMVRKLLVKPVPETP